MHKLKFVKIMTSNLLSKDKIFSRVDVKSKFGVSIENLKVISSVTKDTTPQISFLFSYKYKLEKDAEVRSAREDFYVSLQ